MKVLEHTSDETLGVFETDTLTLAMGLLTAVLSQPDKVRCIHSTGHVIVWLTAIKTLGVKLLKLFVESGRKSLVSTLRTFCNLYKP